MPTLSKNAKQRLTIALTDAKAGKEVADAIESGGGGSGTITVNPVFFTGDGSPSSPLSSRGYYHYQNDVTLSGVFNGSVVCNGTITVSGNLTVNGDLIADRIESNSGASLNVLGDLIVSENFEFTIDPEGSQAPIEIGGNVICKYFSMNSDFSQSTYMDIQGDLVCNEFYGQGVNGARGLNLNVEGNITAGEINLDGGNADLALGRNAGAGGYLFCRGDVSTNDGVSLQGGYNFTGTDLESGSGGSFECYGNVRGSISVSARYNDDGSAGYGGDIYVSGSYTNGTLSADGGSCYSSDLSHSSGSGGYIDLSKDTNASYIEANAGFRQINSPTGSETFSEAYAGTVNCYGNLSVFAIYLRGMSINTNGTVTKNTTDGGYLFVEGNLTASDWIDLDGGINQGSGNGGNGGQIQCNGRLQSNSVVSLSGRASTGGNSGGGGTLNIRHGASIRELRMTDANELTATSSVSATLGGHCSILILDMTTRGKILASANLVPCVLKVNIFQNKDTLNVNPSSETVSLTATNPESLYFGDGNTWYAVAGTSIMV